MTNIMLDENVLGLAEPLIEAGYTVKKFTSGMPDSQIFSKLKEMPEWIFVTQDQRLAQRFRLHNMPCITVDFSMRNLARLYVIPRIQEFENGEKVKEI